MTATVEPAQSGDSRLRPRLISLLVLLIGLTSLSVNAYRQWSGSTPGWAAPAFSFVGFLVFCEWITSGAPGSPGPHDVDLSRFEIVACAAGFLANVLLVAGIVVGLFGAQRLARTFGRIAFGLGLASIGLLRIAVDLFELGPGGYLWLAAMALLAFSRLNRPGSVPRAAD